MMNNQDYKERLLKQLEMAIHTETDPEKTKRLEERLLQVKTSLSTDFPTESIDRNIKTENLTFDISAALQIDGGYVPPNYTLVDYNRLRDKFNAMTIQGSNQSISIGLAGAFLGITFTEIVNISISIGNKAGDLGIHIVAGILSFIMLCASSLQAFISIKQTKMWEEEIKKILEERRKI